MQISALGTVLLPPHTIELMQEALRDLSKYFVRRIDLIWGARQQEQYIRAADLASSPSFAPADPPRKPVYPRPLSAPPAPTTYHAVRLEVKLLGSTRPGLKPTTTPPECISMSINLPSARRRRNYWLWAQPLVIPFFSCRKRTSVWTAPLPSLLTKWSGVSTSFTILDPGDRSSPTPRAAMVSRVLTILPSDRFLCPSEVQHF